MAFREVGVHEIKEVLRLWLRGEGIRSVARLAGVDRKTVRRYVEAAGECGLDRDGGEGQLGEVLLSQVAERRGITEMNGGLEIGALTTLTEVTQHPVVRERYGLLIIIALGIPVGTVRSRLHRARLRLRELIAASGRYLPDDPRAEASPADG